MPTQPYLFTHKAAAILLSIAVALALLTTPGILSASGAAQDSSATPEITDPECSFGMDYDDDGERDEPFDAEPNQYILQETSIAGGCTFQLRAPVAATLIVESDLQDWEIQVELQREPNPPDSYTTYPGDPNIDNVQGRMEVTANFRRGDTPRSMEPRTLDGEYQYEAQIPEAFRLLEITVTTPEGLKDRLERNVHSASGEYIKVHRKLSGSADELPDWANALAEEWLEEGYPQVADSIINQALGTDEDDGSSTNGWMWAAIATWTVVAILILGGIAVFFIFFAGGGPPVAGGGPPVAGGGPPVAGGGPPVNWAAIATWTVVAILILGGIAVFFIFFAGGGPPVN